MSSSSSSKSAREEKIGLINAQLLEEDESRRLLDDPQNIPSQEHFMVPMPRIHEEEDHKSSRGSLIQPPQLIREVSDG